MYIEMNLKMCVMLDIFGVNFEVFAINTLICTQATGTDMYSGTLLYRGPWDHKNCLVISGFSLYQGKKQKYKELGPAKLPCYKRILLYPTSL